MQCVHLHTFGVALSYAFDLCKRRMLGAQRSALENSTITVPTQQSVWYNILLTVYLLSLYTPSFGNQSINRDASLPMCTRVAVYRRACHFTVA